MQLRLRELRVVSQPSISSQKKQPAYPRRRCSVRSHPSRTTQCHEKCLYHVSQKISLLPLSGHPSTLRQHRAQDSGAVLRLNLPSCGPIKPTCKNASRALWIQSSRRTKRLTELAHVHMCTHAHTHKRTHAQTHIHTLYIYTHTTCAHARTNTGTIARARARKR